MNTTKNKSRIFPYRNSKPRPAGRLDQSPTPESFVAPIPCLVGNESVRRGKKMVRYLCVDEWSGYSTTRELATVCGSQSVAELLVEVAGKYAGYRGTFVEPL